MNDPAAPAPTPVRAGFWHRATARAIDMLVTAVLACALALVAALIAAYLTAESFWHDPGPTNTAFGLLLVPVLAVVARYEVAYIARRGQTFGMGLAGIRVVRYQDPDALGGDRRLCNLGESILRWAIPHGAGLSVGFVSLQVAIPRIKDYGGYVGVAAGVAVWALVYASSLFDAGGRGWHDKAAGTIVIQARMQDEPTRGREIPQKWQGWRGVPFS